MPIQEQNIVFVESQVMDDVPEGGGAATGTVIVDGQMNNVFEDISDLDRAYGRFNLRKIFLAVRTLSTDLYGGAKTVVTALPADDALGYTLFSSGDPFDTRAQAADRVEAYLYKGPMWAGYLYENHIQGMRAINLIQKVGSVLPPVGKTLTLVANEGVQGEVEQYVRVINVQYAEQFFVDGIASDGSDTGFARWIVTLTLSDALRFDFKGHTIKRLDTDYKYTAGETRVRNTTVADATRYFGAQRLALAANIGDLQVKAASQFTKLVPSAQTETPLVNQVLNPSVVVTMSAGTRDVDIAQQAHTLGRPVTVENRRLNWIETLAPIPAPGTLSVAYRAQDNWFELLDNGSGQLVGSDPSIGAGTLNYTTGAMSVTLGALPDAYSTVILTWGSPVHYVSLVPEAAPVAEMVIAAPTITDPITPGTLVLTWQAAGIAKTASDNGSGALTGDASGSVDYAAPRITFAPSAMPDAGTGIGVAYTKAPATTAAPAANTVNVGAALAIYGVRAHIRLDLPDGTMGGGMLYDDGAGNLKLNPFSAGPQFVGGGPYYVGGTVVLGSVDYATGQIVVNNSVAVSLYEWSGYAWTYQAGASVPATLDDLSYVLAAGASPGAANITVPVGETPEGMPTIHIDTLPITLVPNSLEFTYGGKTYQDRNGTLYADIDPVTGSGMPAGSVDYATRRATVTYAAPNASGAPVITSALGRYGDWTTTTAVFRTQLAPLKPESVSIIAVAQGLGQINGVADADGAIAGAGFVSGSVNYEFGVSSVVFTTFVDPASIRYNAVAYSYLPLDADILGIDPVRLPSDGRVPIYRPGDVVMVMHAADTEPATVLTGGTVELGRTRIAWVRVTDATGASVVTGYTLDREAGVVTFTDITGITMPVTIRHTVADLRQITDAQISGQLTLARPLTHAYPDGESIVASCLIHGDRRARVSATWDQATWSGTWTDSLAGSEATATLDTIAHPITVTNEGAETERWLLRWTSTTAVELIGERRGLVYSGPYTADIAPINPRTREPDGSGGVPYLTIPLAANGGGWSAGNVVRINTVGAIADIWIARAIQQSDEPAGDGADGCELYALGNIDRP